MSTVKGGKPKKTNWVMHQYHLGTGEDEQNGEYVVSKLFFQQQFKPEEKSALELTNTDAMETLVAEGDLSDLPEPTMEEEDERISSISNQEVLLNNEYNADEEALHSHEHNTYQVVAYSYRFISVHYTFLVKLSLQTKHRKCLR